MGSIEETVKEIKPEPLILSTLPKTWILDLDGTLVKHNGYKLDGTDTLLLGAKEYVDSLPSEDFILILTSRTEEYRKMTLDFLRKTASDMMRSSLICRWGSGS